MASATQPATQPTSQDATRSAAGEMAPTPDSTVAGERQLLHAILANTGDAIIATDVAGRIRTFNPAAEAMLGYTAAAVIGSLSPTDFHLPVELEQRASRFLGPFPLAGRGPSATPQRWTYVRGDGGHVIVMLRAAELRDATGQLTGYIGLAEDITDREHTEAAIGELIERLELATRAANIGVWDWDLLQNTLFWDDNMHRIVGTSPMSMEEASANWLEYVHPDERRAVEESVSEALGGMRPYDTTFRIVRPDGAIRHVRAVASVLMMGEGARPWRMVGVCMDITREKQAEEQRRQTEENLRHSEDRLRLVNAELKRAARLKDEFLANMSHELRTPLNAILVIGEALGEEVYGPLAPRQVDALHDVVESGSHLLALINDILDLSKIEAGKMELQLGAVDIGALCNASLRLLREQAQKKRQSMLLSLPEQPPMLQADERRLKQLLVNLLSNAVKFTPEDGKIGIEVLADPSQQMITLVVWDTGIGIPSEMMAQIFQPFIQVDSALTRRHGGTGLGLALVRRLAQMHGGFVTVESEVGQGSRFSVTLPWLPAEPEALPDVTPAFRWPDDAAHAAQTLNRHPASGNQPAPASPFGFNLAGVAILVADDNEMNRVAIVDLLRQLGANVAEAEDGEQAVAVAQAAPPDVILMDIQMANVDGIEAIRRIRRDPRFLATPIVALTALVMPEDRERCLAAGATDFISKPVSLKHLVQRIHELVNPHSPA